MVIADSLGCKPNAVGVGHAIFQRFVASVNDVVRDPGDETGEIAGDFTGGTKVSPASVVLLSNALHLKSRPHIEQNKTVGPALQECVLLVVFHRPPA